jgi:hypothetical protein
MASAHVLNEKQFSDEFTLTDQGGVWTRNKHGVRIDIVRLGETWQIKINNSAALTEAASTSFPVFEFPNKDQAIKYAYRWFRTRKR